MGRKPLGPWVVAGVDGSPDALAAVEVAAAEAAMRGLRLRVVAAWPPLDGGNTYGGTTYGGNTIAAQVEANRAAAEAASRAHQTRPDLTVRALVVSGDPAQTLILQSRTAGLLVLGCRGQGGGSGPGPVCDQVATHAQCPTLVVPPYLEDRVGISGAPVVVGVDAVGWDDAAIGFAFEEAHLRGVPLRAAHVCPNMPGLTEVLAGWAEKYPRVRVERVPLHDANPARALLLASDGAGLVVLGARPRLGDHGQSLRMTAKMLIARAGCPVCVVPIADQAVSSML